MDRFVPTSFGWQPDLPDFRDFTYDTDEVRKALQDLKTRRGRDGLPGSVDLREFFLEPFDQGTLASSPAHACAALLEYFERRSHGHVLPPSRLFLHRNARHMAMTSNHTVNLRATLKVIARCGLPPERYWPYDVNNADLDPNAFLYSFVDRFRELLYVRLGNHNTPCNIILDNVRSSLAAGFPTVFGLAVPSSISRAPEILYRPAFDSIIGGQALVAVGYDDKWLRSTRGALLVLNSWGIDWGDQGYGWLPYAFIEQRLAVDFWTMLRSDWIESGEFFHPMT